ncbi:tetratricopeptide repeat protein [Caloranaerobacter sp. DY30410]|uniref:tetratricopeptide repeat protein n=1 Tax=Caloranaerobacter sp. DY30410 TaxID=3238305 RepID=UPI003D0534B5
MLVNRISFIIVTFVMMITLFIFTKNIILAGGVTFITVIAGYIVIAYMRNKKRLKLLEENCDPKAFLEATEKQMDITGKNPKIKTYLTIDKAAGLILMGEFQKAKEVLLSIEKSYLSVKNGTLLAYTINLISCLYELGEISYAEELFETQIPILPPVNQRMTLAMKLLVAERFFFLNRYEESKEKFQQLLSEKISKCIRLGILYRLAQIDEKTGDIVSAQKKYKEVSDNGNKLWIAIQAQKHLKRI